VLIPWITIKLLVIKTLLGRWRCAVVAEAARNNQPAEQS
jgi:hypothetical protein